MNKSESKKIVDLKNRIKDLEEELQAIKEDRQKFRDYWVGKLKWFLELHGKGSHPNMAWLIEDMSKFLNRVKTWYW